LTCPFWTSTMEISRLWYFILPCLILNSKHNEFATVIVKKTILMPNESEKG
jgi:hypothetical protein